MPRGGPRPGAGRPKGSKKKSSVQNEHMKTIIPAAELANMEPLEYLLRIMKNPDEDQERRIKCAYYALPYTVPKATGNTGKKEQRQEKAKKAGSGKFKQGSAPLKRIK